MNQRLTVSILKWILLSLSSLILSACEEAFDWSGESTTNSYLVVEGQITNQKRSHTIKLSHTLSEPNQIPRPARGAEVWVSDGDTVIPFTEIKPGLYASEAFRALFGRPYSLLIRYQDREYRASTYSVPVAPLPPLALETTAEGLFRYQASPSNQPAMTEVFLDWSQVEGYQNQDPQLSRARLYFYTLQTLDVPQLFQAEQEEVLFPAGTRIIRRNYSLSPEQEAFTRSLLLETQWQGSPFDGERANLPTNLEGGALGYFAASTVVADSTTAK